MNLIENINPKGFVVIKDKDGNIIQANYNTIVNEGRKTILSKLLSDLFIDGDDEGAIDGIDKSYKDYEFYAICLGKATGETKPSDTFKSINEYSPTISVNGDSINNPFWFYLHSDDGDNIVNEYKLNFDSEANKYYLSITIRVVPGSVQTTDIIEAISSLAIIMRNVKKQGTDEEYHLFSRFRFDTIPITSESEFILTYYVYF